MKHYLTENGIAVIARAVEVCELYRIGPVANQPRCQGRVPTNDSCTGKHEKNQINVAAGKP